jgi:hypothetical protein
VLNKAMRENFLSDASVEAGSDELDLVDVISSGIAHLPPSFGVFVTSSPESLVETRLESYFFRLMFLLGEIEVF